MKVGFTGTRVGMTQRQRASVIELLLRLPITEGHHGDCVGADAQFHATCSVMSHHPAKLVIHPPVDTAHQAHCDSEFVREAKTHFARNRDIVDETELLIGTPFGPDNGRGGTWYTINYARKRGKPVYIVWPDGDVTHERTGILSTTGGQSVDTSHNRQ